MKTALDSLIKARLEKKELSLQDRIAAREKSFPTDQPGIQRVKAKLFEAGIPKLGKEEKM